MNCNVRVRKPSKLPKTITGNNLKGIFNSFDSLANCQVLMTKPGKVSHNKVNCIYNVILFM